MAITAINETFVNALLADAAYVDLKDISNNIIFNEDKIRSNLALRLTQPLADFITQNFTIKDQETITNDGFSAVVWQGKAGKNYTERT